MEPVDLYPADRLGSSLSQAEVEFADGGGVFGGRIGEGAGVQDDLDVVDVGVVNLWGEAFLSKSSRDRLNRVAAGEGAGIRGGDGAASFMGTDARSDGVGQEGGEASVGAGVGGRVGTRSPVAVARPAGVAIGLDRFEHQARLDETGQVQADRVGMDGEGRGELADADRLGGGPHRIPHPPPGRLGQHPSSELERIFPSGRRALHCQELSGSWRQ